MGKSDHSYIQYDLDEIPTHLRSKAWTEASKKFFYEYDIEMPGDFRTGELKGFSAGDLKVAEIKSDPMSVFRRPAHVRHNALDAFFVLIPSNEEIFLAQRSKEVIVKNKQFTLVSTSEPYIYKQKSHTSFSNLIVPGDLLRIFAPGIDDIVSLQSENNPIASMFLEISKTLCARCDEIDDETRFILSNRAVELLGLALDGADLASNATSIQFVHFRRLIRIINRQFSNPRLGVSFISEQLNISSRYLHYIAKKQCTTVSSLIKSRRIEEAKFILRNDTSRKRSITEICYSIGFSSLSHFSREFKRATGYSPIDYADS